jgi:fatty acid synthase subunit beta
MATQPVPTRPLVLSSSTARLTVPVPAEPLSAWLTSEELAQEFHHATSSIQDDPLPDEEEDDEGATQSPLSVEPQVKLLARFLSFATDQQQGKPNAELLHVLLAAYNRFNELFLTTVNVHSLVQSFQPETRTEILTAYYKAFAAARTAFGPQRVKIAHSSALIEAARAGKADMYALFGGQGVNEVCDHLNYSAEC